MSLLGPPSDTDVSHSKRCQFHPLQDDQTSPQAGLMIMQDICWVGRARVARSRLRRGRANEQDRRDPPDAKRMVGRGGLEPPTSRLSGVRSNHLSYRPISRHAEAGGLVEPIGIEPMTS